MGEGSEQSVGAASRRRLAGWMIGLIALGVGILLGLSMLIKEIGSGCCRALAAHPVRR